MVGFKTTTEKEVQEQFEIGLNMLKKTNCDLVLSRDVVTKNNLIVTPENEFFGFTTNRNTILKTLADKIKEISILQTERLK